MVKSDPEPESFQAQSEWAQCPAATWSDREGKL